MFITLWSHFPQQTLSSSTKNFYTTISSSFFASLVVENSNFRYLVCNVVGMLSGWLSFGIMSMPSADPIALHKEICHAGKLPLTHNVCILATGNNFTSTPITDMATKNSGRLPKAVLHHLSKGNSDRFTLSCIKWSVTSGVERLQNKPKRKIFDIHHSFVRLGLTC